MSAANKSGTAAEPLVAVKDRRVSVENHPLGLLALDIQACIPGVNDTTTVSLILDCTTFQVYGASFVSGSSFGRVRVTVEEWPHSTTSPDGDSQ